MPWFNIQVATGRGYTLAHVLGLFFGLLLIGHVAAQKPQTTAQTKADLQQLQTKITHLQKNIQQVQAKRDALNRELADIAKKISANVQHQQQIHKQMQQAQQQITLLQQQMLRLNERLRQNQQILVHHLRARYHLNEYQPLKWLFNQQQPHQFDRILTYYQYMLRADRHLIDEVRDLQQAQLTEQAKLQQQLQLIQSLQQQQLQQQQQYQQNQRQHAMLLQRLNQDILTKQQTLALFRRNQNNLTQLLTKLARQSVLQTRHPFTHMQHKLIKPVQNLGVKNINHGILFLSHEGSPVYAVYPGKIVFSDWLNGYGLLLIIDHGWGFMTLYANNQALMKTKGDVINQGEQIATVGHSGAFLQNGLYFEIRHYGKAVSPRDWLSH